MRYWILGLRQINTCSKVPLQVNFFRRRHFALLSVRLIFLRSDYSDYSDYCTSGLDIFIPCAELCGPLNDVGEKGEVFINTHW
jgi:hypothetical protein